MKHRQGRKPITLNRLQQKGWFRLMRGYVFSILVVCVSVPALGQNVVAWGSDAFHQTEVPPSATNVVAVACGYAHSLALRADGTVVAWGSNYLGAATVPKSATNVVAI